MTGALSMAEPCVEVAVDVTFLRMDAPPVDRPRALPEGMTVETLPRCSVPFYRYLYDTVGGPWLWWMRRAAGDAEIAALLAHPAISVHVLYGGGEMTDRGAHIIDLAQLGLGMDETGPVSISAKGKRAQGGAFDAFFDFSFENVYANGTKLIGSTNAPRGLKFIGEDGWIMVHIHGGRLEASDPRLIDPADAKDNKISIGRSPGHHQNFLDCIKSGKQPVASGEIGHRTGTICHLNNIAMKLGRPLKWNPEAEKFINDDEANRLLAPPKRAWLGGANSLPF